jgi:uncharacterized protein YjbI with pentapeptide repeats
LRVDANFINATLTGANFTCAVVRGANVARTGFTAAQLYSTASYQNHDLRGITLGSDFSGWNFAGQDLSGATFVSLASFSGTDFSHANLTNATANADLSSANLTAADARGAQSFIAARSVRTTNLIFPDGHIAGLDLTGGQLLLVRNYHGNPATSPPTGPLPIVVDQHLRMDSTGVLSVMLDADQWDSLITFASAIPVSLGGGTLELSFANDVDVNEQIGRTFRIFDWTGVSPSGSFTLSSAYAWDLSALYTSGQVTLVPEPGSLALLCLGTLAELNRRRPINAGARSRARIGTGHSVRGRFRLRLNRV